MDLELCCGGWRIGCSKLRDGQPNAVHATRHAWPNCTTINHGPPVKLRVFMVGAWNVRRLYCSTLLYSAGCRKPTINWIFLIVHLTSHGLIVADVCTKCNLAISAGGCKCDNNCNCLPSSSPLPLRSPTPSPSMPPLPVQPRFHDE
jgi:hypothetical protein